MKQHLLGQYAWWLPRLCILCASLLLAVFLVRNTLIDPHTREYREDAVHRNYLETFIQEGILNYDRNARKVTIHEDVFLAWFEEKSDLGRDMAAVRAELQNGEYSKEKRDARKRLIEKGILGTDQNNQPVLNEERYRQKAALYPSGHYFQLARRNIERFHLSKGGITWDDFYLREPNTFPIDPMIPRGRFFDRNGVQLTQWNGGRSEQKSNISGVYHVIGRQNQYGLERFLKDRLEGTLDHGVHDLVGLKGNHRKGQDILLSIREDVSRVIYQAFEEKELKGAAVVLEVGSGRVVSAVSAPEPVAGVDLDELMGDKDKPLLNRAWDQVYFPGSTFKPVVATGQLEHPDLENEELRIRTDPNRRVDDRSVFMRVRNYKGLVSPIKLDLGRALAASSNTYFAGQGVLLGEYLPELARRYGFQSQMNLLSNIPETRAYLTAKPSGYPANITYKRGNYPLYAQYALGQNAIKSHPMHMASIVQTIANNGMRITPTLVAGWREGDRVRDNDENSRKFKPFPVPGGVKVIDVSVAKKLQKAFFRGPNTKWGTGYRAPQVYRLKGEGGDKFVTAHRKNAPYGGELIPMGGKTGTAQDGNRSPHAWFIGYAPADNPQYAVAVVVENVGTGAEFAIPIASKALAASFQEFGVRSDSEPVN